MIDKAKLSAIARDAEVSFSQSVDQQDDRMYYSILCEFGEIALDHCEETREALRELLEQGIISIKTEETLTGYLKRLPDSYKESTLGVSIMKINALMSEEKYEEAAVFGEKVLELTPEDSDFRWEVMVHIYNQIGNQEAAIRHLNKLVESEPENMKYAKSLISAYVEINKNNEAEAVIRKLVNAIKNGRNENDEATEIMTESEIKNIQCRILLGISCALNERFEEANAIAEEAIQSNDGGPDSCNLIALLYVCLGDNDTALEYAEKAIKIDPANTIALIIRNKILNHETLNSADVQKILN